MPFLISPARVEVHLDQAAKDLRRPVRGGPPAKERCCPHLRRVLVFEQLTVNPVTGALNRPLSQRNREAFAKAPGRRVIRRTAGARQARQGDAGTSVSLARDRDRAPFFDSWSSVESMDAPRMRSST